MKYSLRSLMIAALVLPPLIAATWFFPSAMLQLVYTIIIAVVMLAAALRIKPAHRPQGRRFCSRAGGMAGISRQTITVIFIAISIVLTSGALLILLFRQYVPNF